MTNSARTRDELAAFTMHTYTATEFRPQIKLEIYSLWGDTLLSRDDAVHHGQTRLLESAGLNGSRCKGGGVWTRGVSRDSRVEV